MKSRYLDFLFSLGMFGIRPGLENMKKILPHFGNPEKRKNIIHCAGTNGKGSTLIMLESLLISEGFKVGTATSPHLISFNERFRMNGNNIDSETLTGIFLEICEVCGIDPDKHQPSDFNQWNTAPTFFETSILIALILFDREDCDYILLETGMGGLLDATNVVDPRLSIITSIGMDHEKYLGNTPCEIASQKLGIVKAGKPFILAAQNYSEIYERALEKESASPLLMYGRDFICRDDFFEFPAFGNRRIQAFSPFLGSHQYMNTITALTAFYFLTGKEPDAERDTYNLASAKWNARLQYISRNPLILVDGAHNPDGCRVLIEYLNKHHGNKKVLLVFTFMVDKKFTEMLNVLEGYNGEITFQPILLDKDRSAKQEDFLSLEENCPHMNFLPAATLKSFTDKLNCEVFKDYELITVSCSLYLAGDFLKALQGNDEKESVYAL